MREVWDAIKLIAMTGCQWALLFKGFRSFQTVWYHFYRMCSEVLFDHYQ